MDEGTILEEGERKIELSEWQKQKKIARQMAGNMAYIAREKTYDCDAIQYSLCDAHS